ncbi:MAG TPA: DUF1684 domain-containing protein [Vicinamibacterales bacterium]|jgi:hypothetical protein|nr:DUF1684 domain-containing protein [Vicinamibacterales bacterium]
MTTRWRDLGIWLISGLVVTGCGGGAPPANDADYVKQLEGARATKDAEFRTAFDSPIPRDKVKELLPLSYFPPDPAYVTPAALKLASERDVVEMPTSTGEVRKEERVGVLEFSLKGQPLTLSAFVEAGSKDVNRLFVPFRDLTSGTETYQAGRYLDLDRTPTGLYNIDFNRAYHPYCYYSSKFDCPYPPGENRLPIPIRAGERLPPSGPASH